MHPRPLRSAISFLSSSFANAEVRRFVQRLVAPALIESFFSALASISSGVSMTSIPHASGYCKLVLRTTSRSSPPIAEGVSARCDYASLGNSLSSSLRTCEALFLPASFSQAELPFTLFQHSSGQCFVEFFSGESRRLCEGQRCLHSKTNHHVQPLRCFSRHIPSRSGRALRSALVASSTVNIRNSKSPEANSLLSNPVLK